MKIKKEKEEEKGKKDKKEKQNNPPDYITIAILHMSHILNSILCVLFYIYRI